MRDDISGLSFLRMFPEPSMSLAAPAPTPTVSQAAGMPSPFQNALARAARARTLLNQQQRYTSPFKQANGLTVGPSRALPKPTLPSTSAARAMQAWRSQGALTPKPATPSTTIQKPPAAKPPASTTTTQTWTGPMPLDAYPHPNGDNGRGLHWIPTTSQSKAVVDRFVAEAQKMGVKWVTFLNNGANVGDNDYLVSKLVGAGIEPIMRLWTPTLQPIQGDVESMVRHYVSMGVHYFQPYNEPNLNAEQPDGVASVDRYLDNWIPAAQAIIRGGGLPGFGALAPGGDKNDVDFLSQALDGLKARGQLGLLDKGWLSMHNYTLNHPIDPTAGGDGFFKFRTYHQILSNALGRDLPIIGTEGGTFVGEQEDKAMPATDSATVTNWATQAYTYMRNQREPWNFAYSFWTIANEAGGGTDPHFREEALIKADGTVSPVVTALESMGA